jgi:hypothetical protein
MALCLFCFNRRELEVEDENGKSAFVLCPECSSRERVSEEEGNFKAAMEAAVNAVEQFTGKRTAQYLRWRVA